MIRLLDRLAGPLLRMVDAEDAHRLAVLGLKFPVFAEKAEEDPRLAVRAIRLDFPNPIGMAAGFDKHAEVPDSLLKLGFGFVEIGTVTPRPQAGNPRPRLFRLPSDEAVINRLGFNSQGADAVLRRLAARKRQRGIVGVNIGANKESADRIADYVSLVGSLAAVADYFAVNISSPNTPGLRDLQQAGALDELLGRVMDAREAAHTGKPAVLIKIAPDLTLRELDDVIVATRRHQIDGMIIGNTTVTRPATLRDKRTAMEAGGLSGRPLFPLATRMLAETYIRVEGAFPLVGVGGIDSGEAAIAKIKAGAALIQIYSALVFHGIDLIPRIKSALLNTLARSGPAEIQALVGVDAAAMTRQPWPVPQSQQPH